MIAKSGFIYAGVGSRQTPPHILDLMERLGKYAAHKGHILRSGGAVGADTAFERGARSVLSDPNPSILEIYRPHHASNDGAAHALAARFHPYYPNLSPYVRNLMARNGYQVLGRDLTSPANLVIAWTPGGEGGGGTGQALRIAKSHGIPIIDLGTPGHSHEPTLADMLRNAGFITT